MVHIHNGILLSSGSDGKATVYNAGYPGSIPGWGRSPGERNGNPLQWVAKSRTQLNDFTSLPQKWTKIFTIKSREATEILEISNQTLKLT